ncbi:MAG: lipocalin family protein, partial [Acidobacteriota bacterium]|nr:lipocalin family protein [Acidobacteriota bacterium]
MGRFNNLVIILCALFISGCATTTTVRLQLPPLETVAYVDLQRYAGTWYELANYPQRFQRGCTATTATYIIREDGEV